MSKPAPLAAALVRKGASAPVSTAPDPAPAPPTETPVHPTAPAKVGTIAVTVRLDPERYERLKQESARSRRTNQAIIVAALDAYL